MRHARMRSMAWSSTYCVSLLVSALLAGRWAAAADPGAVVRYQPPMPPSASFLAGGPGQLVSDTGQGSPGNRNAEPPASEPAEQHLARITRIREIEFAAPRPNGSTLEAVGGPRQSQIHSAMSWVAPRAGHRTLYFNDNPLERHGKTNCSAWQPLISTMRFAVDAMAFPLRRLGDVGSAHTIHAATSPR